MIFRRGACAGLVTVLAASVVALPATAAAAAEPRPHHYPAAGPNDPDYAPLERAYAADGPVACTQGNVNGELHYFYSFEPPCAPNAHDPGGAAGMSVDKAWHTYTTGDPRVVMAYVEAGINWYDPAAKDLQNKVYLNTGELPLPRDASGHSHHRYDLNRDGAVTIADYLHDPRVHDANHNGFLDAEDLIARFSNGTDSDHDGFVDDISGWDFYDHQNDPATYDSTYEHSDNQMLQAGADGNNAFGGVGLCPRCEIMPIKAGAEALDRTDDLAQAWLYACHAGADVIISVTADLGYSSYMNQAIRYCWKRGVVMVESSNDFDSLDHQGGMFHPFVLPGNGNVPNTLGYDFGGTGPLTDTAINADTTTFTSRSDETSWGTHAMFSASTQGGSTSESTPTVGGAFGLLLSWGRQAAAAGDITHPLDAAEAIQVMRATATKVTDPSLPWPGTPGDWNDQYGYGRPNLFAAMKAVAHGNVPPVGWLTSPTWYSLHDPSRQRRVVVTGHVAAPRSSSYRWALQWGLTPKRTCTSYSTEPTSWHTIGHGHGTHAYDGRLGTLSLASIPKSFSHAAYHLSKCKQLETNDLYTVTLRLRVHDAKGRLGEDRRAISVDHESGQLRGFPLRIKPSHHVRGMSIDGTSQPAFADLAGRGRLALVFGDADGRVHAIDPKTHHELPGWPVHTRRTKPVHRYRGIDPGHEPLLGPVAVGDLTHTGRLDVVATSTTGRTYVWTANGRLVKGWPKTLDAGVVRPRIPRPKLSFTRLPHQGATAVPVLVGLTRSKRLDVVQAGWDGRVHAWTAHGHRVPGWPVHVDGASLTPPAGDVEIHDAKIDVPPAVAYLQGGNKPDIVVQSQYDFTRGADIQELGAGNVFAYDAHGKPVPGWPVAKPAIVVYYGSAQEFLTEGSTAPVSARVSGSTDSVAVAPGIFSLSYLVGGDGNTQATYGPFPTSLATIFGGAYDPTQLAAGNLPDDTPVTFTTTGAFGHFADPATLGYAQAGSGAATVATGLLLNGSGTAIASFERGYDAATGAPAPGFPGKIQGLDFLGEPLIVPVTATGTNAVIDGADSSTLHAVTATGQATGFPKYTSGWVTFSGSAGDALSTGHVDVAVATREGYLEAWHTRGPAAANTDWWSYQHDERRTGHYGTDARPPGTLRNVRWKRGAATAAFTLPGDDWYAGRLARYDIAFLGGTATNRRGKVVAVTRSNGFAAGTRVHRNVPTWAKRVWVQARDDAGNLGPAVELSAANGHATAGAGRLWPHRLTTATGAHTAKPTSAATMRPAAVVARQSVAHTAGSTGPAWLGAVTALAGVAVVRRRRFVSRRRGA